MGPAPDREEENKRIALASLWIYQIENELQTHQIYQVF